MPFSEKHQIIYNTLYPEYKQMYDESDLDGFINVFYDQFDGTKDLYRAMFAHLILSKASEYMHYLPLRVAIKYLEPNPENEYITRANMIGVVLGDSEPALHLHIKKGHTPTVLEMTYLLMHEFRHVIQLQHKPLRECLDNLGFHHLERWASSSASVDEVRHVLHDFYPAEVDANCFASIVTGVPYPGSTFSANPDRINSLGKVS